MAQLDYSELNEEQQKFVQEYKHIHDRLTEINKIMDLIKEESKTLISELNTLRKKENKLFKDGKK